MIASRRRRGASCRASRAAGHSHRVGPSRKTYIENEPRTVDHSARGSMKTAANCESQCKMHYLLNRSSTRRTHMAAHYVGHVCPRVGYTSARARTVSTERRRAAVSRWRTNPPPRRTAAVTPTGDGRRRYEGFTGSGSVPQSASLQRAASSGRVAAGPRSRATPRGSVLSGPGHAPTSPRHGTAVESEGVCSPPLTGRTAFGFR